MVSARTGNRKSLDMTMFVTSQVNYYNAQQRVGYHKRKFGPHNQSIVKTLQREVMSVDALHIYVILPKKLCATDALLSPWELMPYYLIMSHTKDIYQFDKWRNYTLVSGFEDLGKLKVIGTNLFLLSRERIPNFSNASVYCIGHEYIRTHVVCSFAK